MEFLKRLSEIKEIHKEDCRERKNGTVLYGSDKELPLYARHKFYKPLDDKLINEYLISEYRYTIPEQYIEILKYSNGADLFITKLKIKEFKIAHGMLIIYGLPRVAPFVRPQDEEEPFDIRIEDLARHDDIPDTWLKCGSYTEESDFDTTYDIFVDTVNGNVYSCKKCESDICMRWDTLDDCLCKLYELLINTKDEYGLLT